MEGDGGPDVHVVFADLGVAQHTTGRRDLGLAAGRDLAALRKLSRIQCLALDFDFYGVLI